MESKKVALITGANKGIGFEVARQLGRRDFIVLIGARDEARGQEAASKLSGEEIDARHVRIDVTDASSISDAAAWIDSEIGRLDVLINNAGITAGARTAPSGTTVDQLREVYETNVYGVLAVTNAMLPLLRKASQARIVNLSSGLGSLTLSSDPGSLYAQINVAAYQSSKSALNMLTVGYAKELAETGIKVNAADPGYTATDLNNNQGHRTTEQASIVVVRLATLPEDGPTGSYQDEDGIVPW